jgi:hypothetical protein
MESLEYRTFEGSVLPTGLDSVLSYLLPTGLYTLYYVALLSVLYYLLVCILCTMLPFGLYTVVCILWSVYRGLYTVVCSLSSYPTSLCILGISLHASVLSHESGLAIPLHVLPVAYRRTIVMILASLDIFFFFCFWHIFI